MAHDLARQLLACARQVAQLLDWAGLCPRLDESAGKRRSTRIRRGATWLKPVLVQSALAAGRKKNIRKAA